MGDAPVLSHFFVKKSLTKTDWCAGALSWRRNQLLVLHFSGCFLLTTSVMWQRMFLYISVFKVPVPINYTSEFWEFFEATTSFKWTFQTTAVGCKFKCWQWGTNDIWMKILCACIPGVQTFSKNLGATSKFYVPKGWHATSSVWSRNVRCHRKLY